MTVGIDAQLFPVDNYYDIEIGSDGDITSVDFFDTAIIVSLFAERRALESEVWNASQRRGWIGNESTPGVEIGSKLWLYEQSRLTRTMLNGIQDVIAEALKWFVEDGHAVSIDGVEARITNSGITLSVTIRRTNSETISRSFQLWQNTAVNQRDIIL